jgi:hypothetical protein
MTLQDSERALILQTLEATGGRIGGPKWAGLKLGLTQITPIYRMKKLDIYQPLWRTAALDDFMTDGQFGSPVAL